MGWRAVAGAIRGNAPVVIDKPLVGLPACTGGCQKAHSVKGGWCIDDPALSATQPLDYR